MYSGQYLYITIFILSTYSTLFPVVAEVTLDGSLGPASTLTGPDFIINQSQGQQHGGNLFYSFSQFNINSSESAHFVSDASVNTILSRITGGDPSTINGLLRADANLYFMNPAGIVFGPNSSVDIQGSLHLTTADYLRLDDDAVFFADLGNTSTLTMADVAAFGFLDNTIGSVSLQGTSDAIVNLTDLSDQNFFIVAGDISFTQHSVNARSLYLSAIGSTGEVVFENNDFVISPDMQLADILISRESILNLDTQVDVNNYLSIYADDLMLNSSAFIRVNHEARESWSKIRVNNYKSGVEGGFFFI